MWEYTEKVQEHFLNPKNTGVIEDADGIGEVGSLSCGDALKLYIKVNDEGVITDSKFQTFGCASAIASSSALTEMIIGMHVDEAAKITNKEIAEFLGGLPKAKMHCSVMGQEALEMAIMMYRGEEIPEKDLTGNIICHCFGVTEELIRQTIAENNLTTVEEVTAYTKAGGGCGECIEQIEQILSGELLPDLRKVKKEEPKEVKPLSNLQRMQLVMKAIDEEIRPALQKDGGDLELIDIEGTTVRVALRGACAGCPSSQVTLTDLVQKRLQDLVEPSITVVEA
ncbi:MAG: Fe-S cluster assembly protein NifU [Desulfovibrio sp.]